MPRRTGDFRGLAQASRLRLMDEIQEEPGLLLRELAARTGLHENTVRDHLLVLEREGLVARRTLHPGTRGRPPETYHPVAEPSASAEAARRIDRAAEHGDLLRRVAPDACRTDLGDDALHQLDALYEHLDDVGLQPDLDDATLEIQLVPCPFYALVDSDRSLVCRVHARIISDTLAQATGPVQLSLLEPFAAKDRCLVHLEIMPGPPARADEPQRARASRSMPATTSAPAPTSTSSHSPSA